MAEIKYVVKLNDAGVNAMFRQILDTDGITVLSEASALPQEVRLVAPEILDQYLEAVASTVDAASTALKDANSEPDETVYYACGRAFMELQLLLKTFDKSLMPPTNVL